MLLQLTDTPLVFHGDDDWLFESPVPFSLLFRLMHASSSTHPPVNFVTFPGAPFWNGTRLDHAGVCWTNGEDRTSRDECQLHPQSNGTLWSQHHFVNQPHIARVDFYLQTVWATVPYARTAIEHHANLIAWRERNWHGWLYGAPTTGGAHGEPVTTSAEAPRCVSMRASCVALSPQLSQKVISHLGVMRGLSRATGERVTLSANRDAKMAGSNASGREVETDIPPCEGECLAPAAG
jgi:hypothetical protein